MNRRVLLILLMAVLLLMVIPAAQAAPQAYELTWWTVDGGGGASQGGSYALQGTIGQAEPGILSGDRYTLAEGFWATLQALWNRVFLPIVMKLR